MINPSYNAKLYDQMYSMCSKNIYSRLETKSDEVLNRYRRILQPKGVFQGVIALFDFDRQLRIDCIDDILLSRKEKHNENMNFDGSNKSYNVKDVNPMVSDQDKAKLDDLDRIKKSQSYSMLMMNFITKGFMK